MGRAWALAALLCALAGCGPGYQAGGTCSRDSDCQLCEVCGCSKSYARIDTAGASCSEIAQGDSCTKGIAADCLSGPIQALCVSGHCAGVARLRP